MLKVRLMGTKNDIVWFQKILQRHPKVEVLEISELYSNKGTNKYYRAYAEVQKSNVKSSRYVELQANVGLGLDDVVVTYSDGRVLCIQVKHTRANDTLTFADLVYSAKKTSKSLLAELADSWQEESRKYTEVVPQVFTNRRKGQVSSSTKGEEKFVRPALDVFWKKLSEKIKFAKNF